MEFSSPETPKNGICIGADVPLDPSRFPIETLLASFAAIAGQDPSAELHLAGARQSTDRFLVQNEIERLGLNRQIRFFPYFERLSSFPLKKERYDAWVDASTPIEQLSPMNLAASRRRAPLALFVTPFHPSKHEGNSTLIRQWIRHLRGAGWRIHLLYYGIDQSSVNSGALFNSPLEFDLYREVPVSAAMVGSNNNGLNVHVDDWCGAELLSATEDLVSRHSYDAAIVHYPFISAVLERVPAYTRRILVMHDSFADRNRRMIAEGYPGSGWVSLDEAGEALALSRAETIVALQETEASKFRQLVGDRASVKVIGPVFDSISTRVRTAGARLTLGYCGSSNWVNEGNLIEYLARWIEHPTLPHETEIVLAGGVCTTLERFAPPGLLERVRPRLLGHVNDLRDFFDACDIIINPERGGTGIKIKTLEAMAASKPLLTTAAGSVGTGSTSRWHAAAGFDELVALTAEAIAEREIIPQIAAETTATYAAYVARNRDGLELLLGPLLGARPRYWREKPAPADLQGRPAMIIPDEVHTRGASYHPEEFEKFFARIDVRGKRVLEIGSDFHLASARLFLANGAREVVATNIGDWHAPDVPKGVTFKVGDVSNLNLGEEGFDIVYGIAILEHLPDAEAVARTVQRHLKPGGIGYLQGCPLWTGTLGHHVYVSPDAVAKAEGRSIDGLSKFDTVYSFADESKNPIPHWAHLSMSPEEMADFLVEQDLPRAHAEAIADQVYDRHGDLSGSCSNFRPPSEVIEDFRRHLRVEVVPDRWFNEASQWAARALKKYSREDLETLGLRLWVTREDAPHPAVRPEHTPSVSIVVPMYNVEDHIEECLRSILCQDFADFEIIIVDDASPDQSRIIADRIASEDDRLRIVVHSKNQGLGPARNTGARHARGNYIIFLDSDDRLAGPDALGTLVAAAERTGCEVVVGSCASLLPDGSLRPFDRHHDQEQGGHPGEKHEGEPAFLRALYIPGEGYLPVRAWGTLISKSFYMRFGVDFPASEHEDLPYTPFLYFAANAVWYEPRIVVHYRENPSGISNTSWTDAKLRRYVELWRTMKANLAKFGLERYIGDAAVKFAEHLAWKLNSNGVGAGAEETAIETFAALLIDAGSARNAQLIRWLLDALAPPRFLPDRATPHLYAVLANLPADLLLNNLRERLLRAGAIQPSSVTSHSAPSPKYLVSPEFSPRSSSLVTAAEVARTPSSTRLAKPEPSPEWTANQAFADRILDEYAANGSPAAKAFPAMLTEADRAIYWHAARNFRFAGSIVDSGCFVGGTTRNLVDGLRKNPLFSEVKAQRLIRVYDLFQIDDDYILEHLERNYPERDFRGQKSFLPVFEDNLVDERALLDIRPGDVTSIGYPDKEQIEVFGVDLCKAPFVTDHVVREFFPRVMEGGLVLQQDWIHEFHPHIHLSMLRLDDHFNHYVEFKWGGTVCFTLKKPITKATIKDRFGTDLSWYSDHERNAALLRQLIVRSLYEENKWILTLALGMYHKSQNRMDLAHAAYREACNLYPKFEPSKLTREMIGE